MSDEKMRAEFEEWAMAKQGLDVQRLGLGSYRSLATYNAWHAWQASRKAVCIEVPETFDKRDVKGIDYDEMIEALDKAGVSYK